MKKMIAVIAVVVVMIGGVLAAFWWQSAHTDASAEGNTKLTKVQKITTRDLDKDYPSTPCTVVKLFNEIIVCYYGEEYTDSELRELAQRAWDLLDPERQAENQSVDEYLASVQADIADYKEMGRTVKQTTVCDSSEVKYRKDGDDELAYVSASYFIKEGRSFYNTYEEYVLRKDENDQWRILGFYQTGRDEADGGE